MNDTLALIVILVLAAAIIILLIWKNKKDKKLMNPDAGDSVNEAMGDHERRRDKI